MNSWRASNTCLLNVCAFSHNNLKAFEFTKYLKISHLVTACSALVVLGNLLTPINFWKLHNFKSSMIKSINKSFLEDISVRDIDVERIKIKVLTKLRFLHKTWVGLGGSSWKFCGWESGELLKLWQRNFFGTCQWDVLISISVYNLRMFTFFRLSYHLRSNFFVVSRSYLLTKITVQWRKL